MTDTQPFMDEARELRQRVLWESNASIQHIATALFAAYQRGREDERAEQDRRTDEYYVRWADRHTASSERDKG